MVSNIFKFSRECFFILFFCIANFIVLSMIKPSCNYLGRVGNKTSCGKLAISVEFFFTHLKELDFLFKEKVSVTYPEK